GQQTGELITRVTTDVDKVQDLLTDDVVEALTSALTLGGMLAVLFWMDWQLSLTVAALAPLLLLALARYRDRLKQAERQVRRKEGDVTSLAQETLSSIRLIKAFGREDYERDRFEGHTGEALDATLRVSRTEAAFGFLLDVPGARGARPRRGQVGLGGVRFAYVPGRRVLADITFQAEPGQVVALVGPTGAGKSPLAALIPRLYDPDAGRVLLDGQDVRA